MSGFTGPIKAELPLDGLEAFRLASFGIEYQPQYGEVHGDQDCVTSARWYPFGLSPRIYRPTSGLS